MTSETVTETGSEQSVPAPVDLPPVGEEVNLDASENYFNRELSQLQFNYRVLKQALDTTHPLINRLIFCCIFAIIVMGTNRERAPRVTCNSVI